MTPAQRYFAARKEHRKAMEAHRAALSSGVSDDYHVMSEWREYEIAFNKLNAAVVSGMGTTHG